GKVSLKRVEEAIKVGESWSEMLKNDVDAEEEAIRIYMRQLEEVKDDSVKRLLDRIINDEMRHKSEFEELLRGLKEEKGKEKPAGKEVELLNELLQKEYKLVLDHLYHFFHSRTWEEKDTSLDIAIESMFHMGLLGEEIGKRGGFPNLSLPRTLHTKGYSPEELLRDISEEERAKNLYGEKVREVRDEELKKLFSWIEKHEEYHAGRLSELLGRMKRFTVGGLDEGGHKDT
ncbi:MAG: ferritin-like domain-containing protein, partial [Aquificae bacterium]|nr:ferritin-like domain-containing protein [Aquificota bacterium]